MLLALGEAPSIWIEPSEVVCVRNKTHLGTTLPTLDAEIVTRHGVFIVRGEAGELSDKINAALQTQSFGNVTENEETAAV